MDNYYKNLETIRQGGGSEQARDTGGDTMYRCKSCEIDISFEEYDTCNGLCLDCYRSRLLEQGFDYGEEREGEKNEEN